MSGIVRWNGGAEGERSSCGVVVITSDFESEDRGFNSRQELFPPNQRAVWASTTPQWRMANVECRPHPNVSRELFHCSDQMKRRADFTVTLHEVRSELSSRTPSSNPRRKGSDSAGRAFGTYDILLIGLVDVSCAV